MASKNTLYRRLVAEADERRTVRTHWAPPAGYQNRAERRRLGRAKRLLIKKNRHVLPQPSAADTAFTESEAPT